MTAPWTDRLLIAGVSWARTMVGIVTQPYETYRRIVDRGKSAELFYIAALGALYFASASLVKAPAFRPFLLTKQFVLLAGTAGTSFLVGGITMYVVGTLLGGKGTPGRFLLAWGYTMVPTTYWFLVTSILYVVFPPPRTTATTGIALSMVYLVFSATLLFWKILLGFFSLRFGLRLDFVKITLVAILCAPLFVFYSAAMYTLGVFKVPFL